MSRAYNDRIRELIDFQRFVLENSTCSDKVELQKKMTDFIHLRREELHRMADSMTDPLAKPLTESFRYRYDEDGSGYTEYGILPEDGYTSEDEIRQYIEDYIELPPICGPYDCTGKFFTAWVNWKRTPAGIVIIHCVGRDI